MKNKKPSKLASGNPKNMTDLRNQLAEIFGELRRGEINLNAAATASNLAGKIINSAVAQRDHARALDKRPHIPFMK